MPKDRPPILHHIHHYQNMKIRQCTCVNVYVDKILFSICLSGHTGTGFYEVKLQNINL
ncbi:hypothetical protein C0J52_09547 [Blattella germanica]|nr:hypothetical protein C0J52_09547 [Blattella germanica]